MKLSKITAVLALSIFAVANAQAATVKLVATEKVELTEVVAMAKQNIEISFANLSIENSKTEQAAQSLLVKQTVKKADASKSIKLAQLSE
ncbi:hypothetical protein [Thalassotalea sp. PLHSN55]|uniref:hypothetical protein n=1 Tax=Thalassotalea sp. PLHSN55 TaxID=3435888 RepID=UPI003F82A697